eukprot:13982954-Alexandrium_andersonii.AAC.1
MHPRYTLAVVHQSLAEHGSPPARSERFGAASHASPPRSAPAAPWRPKEGLWHAPGALFGGGGGRRHP